ncbi:cilia- and flagella-associated protein 58-like [Stegodyphus dumicola]|uniref:cilia- and flagella-associated protein 58-like n=1 Tax=Stegodyphus dumicola TaxID=202533 RepID=UPI0015A81830|nr:cilia- and flagella-associated protein 58-like [Stegodyphus dumicola]
MEEDSNQPPEGSTIKIIVTDESANEKELDEEEKEIQAESIVKTYESKKMNESKDDVSTVEKPPSDKLETDTSEMSDLLTDRRSSRRESTALQKMDEKHSWLSELEEKCAKIESTFISKFQYVALSNHFQKYLDQMKSEVTISEVYANFSNLFEKFRTAYIGSQKLKNKMSELRCLKQISEAENRKLKIKLEEKERRVGQLVESLENYRSEIDELHEQKKQLQEEIGELKEEAAKTSDLPDQDSDKERTLVLGEDDENVAKIQELEEKIESLENDLSFSKEREFIYHKRLQQTEQSKSSLQNEITVTKFELQKQITQREKAETAAQEALEQMQERQVVVRNLTSEIQQLQLDLEAAKTHSKSLLKDLRKCQKDLDIATQNSEKLRRDFDIREDRIKALLSQRDSLTAELKTKHSEVYSLKAEIVSVTKDRNSFSRKIAVLEERNIEIETKLQSLKDQNVNQLKELDTLKKEQLELDGKIKELTKQKDNLTEETQKLEQVVARLRSEYKNSEEACRGLEKELDGKKLEIEALHDTIKRQEKVKERMAREAVELNKTISESENEIKRLGIRISGFEKTVTQLRQQLTEELVKFKALAEDERHFRKVSLDAKAEIEQLNDQLTILSKHIQQLKDYNQDIDEHRKKLEVQNKNIIDQLGVAKETLRREVKKREEVEVKLGRKDDLEQKHLRTIADLEHEVRILKQKVKNITEEKDVLNSKLIQRDTEIVSYKEKIRLLEQDLARLDRTLTERVDDIKLLKLQLSQTNRVKCLMTEKVEHLDVTRQELTEAQKLLQREKVKSKAIEDEARRPVNFHRWRILEGTDPDRAQLVAKNHALQKQLTKRMAELDDKELELREKERIADDLREMLRKRSESNAEEQLWACKQELRSRTERLKCLTAENNMFETLCGKYEKQIMALREELKKSKIVKSTKCQRCAKKMRTMR